MKYRILTAAALATSLVFTLFTGLGGAQSRYPLTDRASFSEAAAECVRSIKSRTPVEQTNLKRTIGAAHLYGAHFEESFAEWCVSRGAYVPLAAPYIYGVGDPHESQRQRSFPCYNRWHDDYQVREGDDLRRVQRKVSEDPGISIAEDGQWATSTSPISMPQ